MYIYTAKSRAQRHPAAGQWSALSYMLFSDPLDFASHPIYKNNVPVLAEFPDFVDVNTGVSIASVPAGKDFAAFNHAPCDQSAQAVRCRPFIHQVHSLTPPQLAWAIAQAMAWPLSSKVSSEMLISSTRPSQVWSAVVKR